MSASQALQKATPVKDRFKFMKGLHITITVDVLPGGISPDKANPMATINLHDYVEDTNVDPYDYATASLDAVQDTLDGMDPKAKRW